MLRTRVRPVLAALLIGLVLTACSSEGTPNLGDWTLKTNDLTLTETLRVSETESFYFGTITGLDVTSDGRIVVADREASHVKVLRPNGTLLDTLGRAGEGPGEFQMIGSQQVARGDSLYVYDLMQSRVSVFGPASPHAFERSILISQKKGRIGEVWVSDTGFLGKHLTNAPTTDPTEPQHAPIRRFGPDGTARDSIARWRLGQMAVHQYEEGGFTAESLPFGRDMVLSFGPDQQLYTGWTDALTVKVYRSDGAVDTVASIPTEPQPVTQADRKAGLNDIDDDKLRKTAKKHLPDTKPAFTDLVVASDGRLWVRRPADSPQAETVPWWLLDPDSKTIQKTRLPRTVDLHVVQDRHAYGTTTTEQGAPAVVRYQIESTS